MEDRREGDLGLLHKLLGELQFPLCEKNIVPAAERVGGDLLEFTVPEIAEVVSGRKNIKTAANSVGKQTLKIQFGQGSRRWTGGSKQRRIIPTKSTKQPSRSRRDIFTDISR